MSQFIPKPYKTEAITIRVTLEKLAIINVLSEHYQISRNKFINQCITYAIEHSCLNDSDISQKIINRCKEELL